MSRSKPILLLFALCLGLIGGPGAAQEGPSNSLCPATMTAHVGRPATQPMVCACAPDAPAGPVWGGDPLYTSDSNACTAAVHAGIIAPGAGGRVQVTMLPGLSAYAGSTRNGVESRPFGAWSGSFAVNTASGSASPETAGTQRACPRNMTDHRGTQTLIVCACPPGVVLAPVWGGRPLYTDDSDICTAAVHAGVITAQTGGLIQVATASGLSSYPSVSRHGVAAASFGAWPGSFVVGCDASDASHAGPSCRQ